MPDVRPHDARRQDRSARARCAGKTYVVNFWNSWCIPCRQEAARAAVVLRRSIAANPTSRWSASSATTTRRRCATTSPRNAIGWPVAFDPNGSAGLGFGTTGQPETYVISPDGVAACGTLGPVDGGRARGAGSRPREPGAPALEASWWVPWLALAVVVVIAVRRARGALGAEQLAARHARRASTTSSRARCAPVSRSPTATRRSRARSEPTS